MMTWSAATNALIVIRLRAGGQSMTM